MIVFLLLKFPIVFVNKKEFIFFLDTIYIQSVIYFKQKGIYFFLDTIYIQSTHYPPKLFNFIEAS